jgi:hypothetical protein
VSATQAQCRVLVSPRCACRIALWVFALPTMSPRSLPVAPSLPHGTVVSGTNEDTRWVWSIEERVSMFSLVPWLALSAATPRVE